MTTLDTYRHILHQYWGYDDFRGIQRDIIESIGAGKDTLGLMPTGGGKSITFQVPALAHEGICLVVSPLIALMKDQVAALKKKGIKATAVYTGMSHQDIITQLENCIYGNFKLLYVSPERLSSELFCAKLRHMQVSMIAVDEAHCISQWGYDFRPAYTQISKIRELVPDAPVLALTATATPAVVDDIQRQLRFRQPCVKRMSFARSNLAYRVQHIDTTKEETIHELLCHHPGSAIVYTRNRAATRELAEWLQQRGIEATSFHAGLTDAEKTLRASQWQTGDVRVIVATNAFGMGIDKPDVRCVIHADVPDSPEAYFQEAGRAGRDGHAAFAYLLYDERSRSLLERRVEDTFPPLDYVRRVYEEACFFLQMGMGDGEGVTREFHLDEFCATFRHFPTRAQSALQLLDRAGYIRWQDAEEGRSRVMMAVSREELYDMRLTAQADRVLSMLLRTCTGIFAEYAYVSEDEIARHLGIDQQQVSEQLVLMSRMHILHFIPRSSSPLFTFTQRRVERDEVVLHDDIYACRKREMEHRVSTMTAYLYTTSCRSAFLLGYFGERDAKPCGLCDNCHDEHPTYDLERVHTAIAAQAQQGRLDLTRLRIDGVPDRVVARVARRMMEEEEVTDVFPYSSNQPH